MKTDFMLYMTDTLQSQNIFKAPEEFSHIVSHSGNLDHLTTRDIYFDKSQNKFTP
jgi:hypothetical protein